MFAAIPQRVRTRLCCLFSALLLSAPPALGAPFNETFGLVVKFSQGQPQTQLADLPELGVHWVRDTVPWADVERVPSQFSEWPQAFQERLRFYQAHNIGVVFILAYANTHAYPLTGKDRLASFDAQNLARYAEVVADRLKASGVRFALEVWNEPHNFQVREFFGGKPDGAPPSPWMTQYAHMVRAVTERLQARHPSTPVLSSEDLWEAHRHLASTGLLPRSFRHIGIHPYVHGPNDGPEFLAPSMRQQLKGLLGLGDAPKTFQASLSALRQFTATQTGTYPDVWITEWGWKLGWGVNAGPLDEAGVGALLVRAMMVGAASGAKATFWFSMHDSVDGPWGIIDGRNQRRASFSALRTLNDQLGEWTLVGWLDDQPPEQPGVCGMVFKSDGGSRKLALWHSPNRPIDVLAPAGWRITAAVDGLGKKIALKRQGTGWVLPLAGQPIYVTVTGTSALSLSDLQEF